MFLVIVETANGGDVVKASPEIVFDLVNELLSLDFVLSVEVRKVAVLDV